MRLIGPALHPSRDRMSGWKEQKDSGGGGFECICVTVWRSWLEENLEPPPLLKNSLRVRRFDPSRSGQLVISCPEVSNKTYLKVRGPRVKRDV